MAGGAASSLTACSLLTSLDGLSGGGDAGTNGRTGPFGLSDDASVDDGATNDGLDASKSSEGDSGAQPVGDKDAGASKDASSSSSDAGDGSTLLSCSDGGLLCNGACVDPTTPANCNGCGIVCSSGLCGTTIAAPMTSNPTGWSFNGTAQYNTSAPSAELTLGGGLDQAGTFLYTDAIDIDTMFVTFEFRIGLQGSTRSDGMGFILEQTGPNAVGEYGGGLGMSGLAGYGVELDIFDNAVCGDTSDDHVGVDQLTTCDQSAGTPTSLYETDVSSVLDLADTHWHSAQINVAAGQVSLAIDGTTLFTNVALQGWQSGQAYYVGFSGATGGLVAPDGGGGFRQEVKDVLVTFPHPQCL